MRAPPAQRAPSARGPSGRELPADLEAVILACLHKDRNHRPERARALARKLAACALPSWEHEQASAWWERQAGAIAMTRKAEGGDSRPIESTAPRGTLAIDLVARSREGTAPWHDALEPPA